jgi:plastocyanin
MRKLLAMAAACLALGLVAGCGGDDEEEEAAPAPEEAPQIDAARGKTVEVAMKDIKFDPESLTVKKGTTVKWTNEDSVGHDVTKTGGVGPSFESGEPGAMKKGDTFEQSFTSPGEVEYVCRIHESTMKGSVTVK